MTKEEILKAIDELESFPISEDAQHLINYLRANQEDLEEAMAD